MFPTKILSSLLAHLGTASSVVLTAFLVQSTVFGSGSGQNKEEDEKVPEEVDGEIQKEEVDEPVVDDPEQVQEFDLKPKDEKNIEPNPEDESELKEEKETSKDVEQKGQVPGKDSLPSDVSLKDVTQAMESITQSVLEGSLPGSPDSSVLQEKKNDGAPDGPGGDPNESQRQENGQPSSDTDPSPVPPNNSGGLQDSLNGKGDSEDSATEEGEGGNQKETTVIEGKEEDRDSVESTIDEDQNTSLEPSLGNGQQPEPQASEHAAEVPDTPSQETPEAEEAAEQPDSVESKTDDGNDSGDISGAAGGSNSEGISGESKGDLVVDGGVGGQESKDSPVQEGLGGQGELGQSGPSGEPGMSGGSMLGTGSSSKLEGDFPVDDVMRFFLNVSGSVKSE